MRVGDLWYEYSSQIIRELSQNDFTENLIRVFKLAKPIEKTKGCPLVVMPRQQKYHVVSSKT